MKITSMRHLSFSKVKLEQLRSDLQKHDDERKNYIVNTSQFLELVETLIATIDHINIDCVAPKKLSFIQKLKVEAQNATSSRI